MLPLHGPSPMTSTEIYLLLAILGALLAVILVVGLVLTAKAIPGVV